MIKLKKLCLLLIGLFIFTNCSAAQEKVSPESSDKVNPETKKFESKAGNFSIDISQMPSQTRNLNPEKGQEPGKQFFWQFERTTYSVMYSAFNKDDLSIAFDEMNTGTRKSIQNGGKLISEQENSFGKYSGREFRFILPNGVKYIQRNYLVGNVGYLLSAGYVYDEDEKEALKVLDSFKLLTEMK